MNSDLDFIASIEQAFKKVWPNGDASITGYLTPLIAAFAQSDFCDDHYLEELQSGDLGKVAARIWEAMLHTRFQDLGWTISGSGVGPDFLLNGEVYVEAVTAQPGDPHRSGVPGDWLKKADEHTCTNPFDEMILRWTSVLKTKRDKHLKDIDAGRVAPDLPFVVAVNSCRLGCDTHGINGLPLAVIAVLPFGNPTAKVSVATEETIEGWHIEWRDAIFKQNGEPVATDSFLNDEYRCVSALIGCSDFYADETDRGKFFGQPPFFLVHNPRAANPLPRPWLPGAIEYEVVDVKADSLELKRLADDDLRRT